VERARLGRYNESTIRRPGGAGVPRAGHGRDPLRPDVVAQDLRGAARAVAAVLDIEELISVRRPGRILVPERRVLGEARLAERLRLHVEELDDHVAARAVGRIR